MHASVAAPTRRDALVLGACWFGACRVAAGEAAGQRRRHHLFGSFVELIAPPGFPSAPLDEVLSGLQRLHQSWNAWKPGEVTRLNAAWREGRAAPASPALIDVIGRAAVLERRSLGLFNAGAGGLVAQWGFHEDVLRSGPRPPASFLRHWIARPPSLSDLEIRGHWIRSRNPAVQLDLGAYAKGVAVDWSLDRLRAAGAQRALLNLGGNLAAFGGTRSDPWLIGIRSPFDMGLAATLRIHGREAVVTSGSYERFRLVDGERIGHVLDPLTGGHAPAFVSVTVVHPDAGMADAAATALLVAGPGRWRTVAGRMQVDQVLVIDRDGSAIATPRLAARLQPASGQWRRQVRIA